MRLLKEDDSCTLMLSASGMIVFHMFCNMDVSADSDLKEDLERNGWTISALTVLFWSYIRLMLIDKRQENLEVCCVPYMSRHRVAATLSSSGHYIHYNEQINYCKQGLDLLDLLPRRRGRCRLRALAALVENSVPPLSPVPGKTMLE